jgi:putative ABC transport system substrate-binding protein
MKRYSSLIILSVALGLIGLPPLISAQQSPKPHRLGWLVNLSPSFPPYQAFRDGMRELGYVEGKNIVTEVRSAEGKLDRLPELVRELIGLNVDVLFVAGDQGIRAAKQATDTIPVVFGTCDPLESLVASVARPGGNVTGVTCISSELAGKRLQLLKELVGSLDRVAVLYNPNDRNKAIELRDLDQAARAMNLTLRSYEARSPEEIDSAFVGMIEDRQQTLIALADSLMIFHVKKLADLSLKNRLPAIFGFREFAAAGGLISYGASLHWGYGRVAFYVDKIFKGAKPGDLPIEQPTKFELVINLNAAKALGLKIPDKLLALADEVIE